VKRIALILIGWGEGIIVGAALISFLLVLDIIPRLIRFSGAREQIPLYELLIVAGVTIAINLQFYQLSLPNLWIINQLLTVILGFILGIFIGLVAGALTETLRVLPILGRRLGLKKELEVVLVFMIAGKTVGSLIYWLFPELCP